MFLLVVVLVPANALAPSVTINPEMSWLIGLFLDLEVITVQSIATVRRRS